ncbi:MAG TPA: hypothetical protein DCS19_01265 [Flavobacterium sp.]|nr:hypothetical protein [Flavobacterium sp.]
MPGGNKNIKPTDGKQFSSDYQPKEKWTEKKATDLGIELINWLKEKDDENEDKGHMFFEEFLIIEKDLYPELIAYLSTKFTSFLKLIEKAKKIQELKLVKYGVGDRLNATMTKFVLINCHDFVEKSSTELTGKNGTPLFEQPLFGDE